MALDKVISEILESAQREADERIREAEEERAKILAEANQRIERMQKAEEKELQETLRRQKQQELSSAELESKKIVLNRKKEVLDKTFQEALQELSSIDPKEKAALYKKILTGGKRAVRSPVVYVPKSESGVLAGARGLDRIEEKDMESGIILESRDGSVSMDYRFRTILEGVWEKELKNISSILFG